MFLYDVYNSVEIEGVVVIWKGKTGGKGVRFVGAGKRGRGSRQDMSGQWLLCTDF